MKYSTTVSRQCEVSVRQRTIANTVDVVIAREYPHMTVLQEQVLEWGGGYSADIQIVESDTELRNLMMVIELHGPTHFLRTLALIQNGSTLLKHKHSSQRWGGKCCT